ncbi:MAG: cyanophycin synthetase, partial [Anaerolineales bacterium]
RSRFPENRIWAVWQPHTYARTSRWQAQFGKALDSADQVVVTGVYAAREAQPEDFSLEEVASAVHDPGARAIEKLTDVTVYLLKQVAAGEVVIDFSAGDATQVSRGLLDGLHAREVTP